MVVVTGVASLLIEKGAEIDARDESGLTPLHYAASENSLDVARLLIVHGAEIDARTDRGNTPLHRAISKESLRVARLLKDKGASTDGIDLRWMGYLEDG